MSRKHPNATPGSTPRIAIIGTGFAGIGMAAQLRRAGIDSFTIFEKADAIGGTWRDNSYPGAACDVPSHLYSFSFAPSANWSRRYSPQAEILGYLEGVVEQFDLMPRIRFGTPIVAATFDEATTTWSLETGAGDLIEADVVVSGLGQLNRPAYPEIPGRDRFEGASFHSARWDHDHDLSTGTVGVIGNGASAVQFVPPVAAEAEHLIQFQRSANWIAPKKDPEYSARAKRVFRALPPLVKAYRTYEYLLMDLRWPLFRQGSRLGKVVEAALGKYRAAVIADHDLRAALTPDYPAGCKRILATADYLPALTRDNVSVVTDAITEITHDSILTADGTSHQVDTIVYGTGFQTTEFLSPVRFTGVGGRSLTDDWHEGAEAYLGVTVPGFPNLFLLYGPNTNLSHNSIIFMIECQVHYVMRCLHRLRSQGRSALDTTREASGRYNRKIQSRMGETVWVAGCESWYKNASGKVTNNYPGPTVRYWLATRRPDRSAFRVLRPKPSAKRKPPQSPALP